MHIYQHSGAVSPIGLLAALLGGIVSAAVLGFIYAYFIVWMPFIYLCILGTLGFGFAIGAVVGWAARWGKIRNNLVVGLFGLGCGLLGVYVEWGISPLALIGTQVGLSGFDPRVMLGFMGMLYEKGSWSLGNTTVTGAFLVVVWIIEAGMIVGTSSMIAYVYSATLPFCERCYQWTKTYENIRALSALIVKEETLVRLRTGDLFALNDLPVAEAKCSRFLQIDAACCPSCLDSSFLTLKLVTRTYNEKGEEKLKTEELVTNLVVSPEEIAFARECGQTPPETPPVPPSPEELNFGQPQPPQVDVRPEDLKFQ